MIGANDREAIEEVHVLRSFTPPLTLKHQCISVAAVLEYFGSELGRRFDPDKIYRTLRPPAALAAAAKRSGRLQLFDRHPRDVDIDTATDDEVAQFVVGHATDLTFDGRSLFARVVIWRPDAVAATKAGERALSIASIHDRLLVEGGTFNGEQYDAVMDGRIELTHVALVAHSRTGDATRISLPGII